MKKHLSFAILLASFTASTAYSLTTLDRPVPADNAWRSTFSANGRIIASDSGFDSFNLSITHKQGTPLSAYNNLVLFVTWYGLLYSSLPMPPLSEFSLQLEGSSSALPFIPGTLTAKNYQVAAHVKLAAMSKLFQGFPADELDRRCAQAKDGEIAGSYLANGAFKAQIFHKTTMLKQVDSSGGGLQLHVKCLKPIKAVAPVGR